MANRLNMSRLKNPIKNEPETFTKSVPTGNAKGAIDCRAFESTNRKIDPTPPPIPMSNSSFTYNLSPI